MARAVVFDLDGTLIDSVPDIHAAANRVLAERGLPHVDLTTLRSFIGDGARMLMKRCLSHAAGDAAPRELEHAVARFLEFYSERPAGATVLYPGVRDLIAALIQSGDRLGICTNKPEALTRTILRELSLDAAFDVIIGGDTLPVMKPDPTGLLTAIAALGGEPANAIFVGDSEIDGATARAAGVKFALFTRGYRRGPVSEIPHWIAHDTFAELHCALATAERAPSRNPSSAPAEQPFDI